MKKNMLIKVQGISFLSLKILFLKGNIYGVTNNQLLKIKSDHINLHDENFDILMPDLKSGRKTISGKI